MISGIDTPSAGNVVINDVDLTALTEHDRTIFRRHNIGFIFQLFNLIPTLTVQENILLPLELTGRLKKGHKEHVMKLLSALKLDDRANSFPDKLSGGEQQRVAILRALIHQPQLLLADEPTGNLDTESSKTVLGLLKKLVKKEGKTLVLVTHSMEIAHMADKVYLIRDGKLITKTM
jgi:putative ABC transport system ATP-binding protein